MGASEISYLIELNKRKAELEFKRGYLLRKGKKPEDPQMISFDEELAKLAKQANELESKITTKKILFYPNEAEIAELNAKVAKLKPEELDKAIEKKEGDAYALLEKRGRFIKDNYENRREIAALIEFVNSLPTKVRDEVIEEVRRGKISDLDMSVVDEKVRERLFRLLNRAGVKCALDGYRLLAQSNKGVQWNEVRVQFEGGAVWTIPEERENVEKILKEYVETGNRIQLMNAERTVRKFSAEDEKKFNDLQKQYIELMKKRNELSSR